jgi:hypothetical protein
MSIIYRRVNDEMETMLNSGSRIPKIVNRTCAIRQKNRAYDTKIPQQHQLEFRSKSRLAGVSPLIQDVENPSMGFVFL